MTPEELYSKIKDLQYEDSIEVVSKSFDAWIRAKHSTLKSLRSGMTDYNKLIKQIEPLVDGQNAFYYVKDNGEKVLKHLFYKYAGLTKEEYTQLNEEYSKQKEARLDNGTRLDPQPYLEAIGKLLISDDYRELAVGIIAATGRRPCEVLLRGLFTPVKENQLTFPQYQPISHWLSFSGQLKKRRDTATESYSIATIFPADFIVKSVKRLRKMPEVVEQMSAIKKELEPHIKEYKQQFKEEELDYQIALLENDLADNKFETITNRIVQAYLPQVLEAQHGKERITRSSLRAAYAKLATVRDCPENKNDLMWASRLLGHKEEGGDLRALLTTAGYFDYYVPKESEVPLLDAPKAEPTIVLRGYASDVEAIKLFQEEKGITSQAETLRKIWELAQEAMKAREQKLYEKPKEENEMNHQELLAQVEEMVDQKIALVLEKLQQPAPTAPTAPTVPAVSLPQEPAVQPPKVTSELVSVVEKDFSSMETKDLMGKKIPGSGEEKVRRAVQALRDYNDYTAPSNNERWFVGVRAIQDLSGCHYKPVSEFLKNYKKTVDDHNEKYGLSSQHNKRHKQSIKEIIQGW